LFEAGIPALLYVSDISAVKAGTKINDENGPVRLHQVKPRILFVDDEAAIQDLLARSLASGADGFMRKTDALPERFGAGQRFVPALAD
jgi:hypothetical protein